MSNLFTPVVVVRILSERVVPLFRPWVVLRCAPRSLVSLMTGMVFLPSLLHPCSSSHFLAMLLDAKVNDLWVAILAPIASRWACVLLKAKTKSSKWRGPTAMTWRSSARMRGYMAMDFISMSHGLISSAVTIIDRGSPCGMLAGFLYGSPMPPAMVLYTVISSRIFSYAAKIPVGIPAALSNSNKRSLWI